MVRIFTASLGTEVNTFAPIPTDRSAFENTFYAPPGQHPDTPTLCSAPIVVLRRRAAEEGFELIEGTAAWAEPAGIVSKDAFEGLRDEILGQLEDALSAGPVDAVVLGMHGAMVAQGYDDPEGDLLSQIRAMVGPDCFVSSELDPHSHLTDLRFNSADLLISFKEFSHVDFVERAEELVELSLRAVRGEIKPVMAKFDCKMIEVLPTSRQPMRDFVDKMMTLEHHSKLSSMSLLGELDDSSSVPGGRTWTHEGSDPAILSISCIHGFMAADVEAMGTHILVVTDNDKPKAESLAKELGMEIFSHRGHTRPPYYTIDSAFETARRLREKNPSDGPVTIADVWDNPGGGVAGDSTFMILRALEMNLKGVAVSSICDPQAVILCHAAGEGAQLQLRFGGKTAPLADSGPPVDALVTIRRCVKNALTSYGSSTVPLGDSALIEVPLPSGETPGLMVVLNTNRTQTFDPDAFANLGCDPLAQEILIVKSTNHFFPAFDAISSNVLYVDTGLTHGSPYPSDPTKTNYTKLTRQLWPMVQDPHNIGAEYVPWVGEEPQLEEAQVEVTGVDAVGASAVGHSVAAKL